MDGYEPPIVPVLSEAERIARAEEFFASIPVEVMMYEGTPCFIPFKRPCADDAVRKIQKRSRILFQFCGTGPDSTGAEARSASTADLSGRFRIRELCDGGACGRVGKLPLSPGKLGIARVILEPITHLDRRYGSAVLKSDPRAIFTAASKAQASRRLSDFLSF